MKRVRLPRLYGALLLCAAVLVPAAAPGQAFVVKWMAAGSLHNWYANTGCEIEEGRTQNQQDGLRWPAFYKYQDMQAAKAMWLGCTNFTDEKGVNYTNKVVHVGPRVTGQGEFFSTRFEMISKFPPPTVLVDGEQQLLDENAPVDAVDPTIVPDRMIINEVNSVMGVTMRRVIKYFSQQYHDNYVVYEYTFTNTGNIDDDAEIELPGKTITGFYAYFQYRYAINRDVCYVIGDNPVQWGYNTMNDVRGDGVKNDADDAVNIPGLYSSPHMRILYAWHGKFPPFTQYDNIGGPIWKGYWDKSDTSGRLGSAQFCGSVTIYASTSPTDSADDISQPSTTSYENSDGALTRNNSHTNMNQTAAEYAWISKGHVTPRHADRVEPTGNFAEPKNDPTLGQTGGGFSAAAGYGPWTLGPGQSVRIVIAEGAAGLSQEECRRIGLQYKRGQITAVQKNTSVLTGKDSLFQTFRRAIANYRSGYAIPREPFPPRSLTLNSGGDKISLTWEVQPAGPPIAGFRIYRAAGKQDTIYTKIYDAGPGDRSYNDTAVVRGVNQYYYIQSVGQDRPGDPLTLTPSGPLLSNRQYAQTGGVTGKGAVLKRAAGATMSDIRIVPNPFSIAADINTLRFKGEPDKIAFYGIPGSCRIKIYTELGELIKEIEHNDGSGDDYWNSFTSSNQVVVSGIYIVVFENTTTGERVIRKLAVIR